MLCCSRGAWIKSDGATVHFLSLIKQLEIVSAGETVHLIGRPREPLRVLKRLRAIAVCHPLSTGAFCMGGASPAA